MSASAAQRGTDYRSAVRAIEQVRSTSHDFRLKVGIMSDLAPLTTRLTTYKDFLNDNAGALIGNQVTSVPIVNRQTLGFAFCF